MVMSTIIQDNYLLTLPVALPFPGAVRVHPGQAVEVGDVIAEAIMPKKYQVFDVLNQFRIREAQLEGCIKRLAGEEVQRGDVIAKKPGLFSRFFRAPEDGKVVAVRDGRVTLAMGEKTIQAISPIAGTIGELLPGMGAVVVASGLRYRGNWGNGKVAIGYLHHLDEISESRLETTENTIVFFDGTITLKELLAIQKAGADGAVVTALDPSGVSSYQDLDLPLVSLLGFGWAQLDPFSRSIIENLESKQVYLVARGTADDQKPELFQPASDAQAAALFEEAEEPLIGQTVRLLGQLYFGSVGKVVQAPEKRQQLPSGMQSQVVAVEREDGSVIRVPVENIEKLTN